MSDSARSVFYLLAILALYGIVGRWDYEDAASASAIHLTCNPLTPTATHLTQRVSGSWHTTRVPVHVESAVAPEEEGAPRVLRCVLVR